MGMNNQNIKIESKNDGSFNISNEDIHLEQIARFLYSIYKKSKKSNSDE